MIPLLLAALSGGCAALAFPPVGLWWLAPVAVALLVRATRGQHWRPALGLGLVHGLVSFIVLLQWLHVVGVDAWLVVALLEALLLAPLGVALAFAQRVPWWPPLVAGLVVAEEAVRARIPFGGFPWGRLAFSQADTPYTPYAALGGAPLVSFAVALAGALLLAAVDALSRRDWAQGGGWLAGHVALAGLALTLSLPTAGQADGDRPATATVALVQGNVPRLGLDFLGQRQAVLNNHAAATRELAAAVGRGELPAPELVLWPENASDLDPFTDSGAHGVIDAAVKAVGVPVLVGAVLDDPLDPEHYVLNAGVVWDPAGGPGERYVKRHPVPFGEYLPFRATLTRLVGRFALVPRDFRHGKGPGVLDVGPARIGDVICFEVAYDAVVRDAVRSGGRALVVQTNNATYGRTGESDQQLAMSRLRAVEHGRAVLVVATSGISAVIAPDGRLVRRSAEFTRDLLVSTVPLRDSLTVADRLRGGPELALSLLAVVGLVVAIRRKETSA